MAIIVCDLFGVLRQYTAYSKTALQATTINYNSKTKLVYTYFVDASNTNSFNRMVWGLLMNVYNLYCNTTGHTAWEEHTCRGQLGHKRNIIGNFERSTYLNWHWQCHEPRATHTTPHMRISHIQWGVFAPWSRGTMIGAVDYYHLGKNFYNDCILRQMIASFACHKHVLCMAHDDALQFSLSLSLSQQQCQCHAHNSCDCIAYMYEYEILYNIYMFRRLVIQMFTKQHNLHSIDIKANAVQCLRLQNTQPCAMYQSTIPILK